MTIPEEMNTGLSNSEDVLSRGLQNLAYRYDLSPIKLKWNSFITFSNVGLEASLNRLRERTDAGVHSITKGGRQGYSQYVRTTEETS